MKPRRVMIQLEAQTDLPLDRLKRRGIWQRIADEHKARTAIPAGQEFTVHQVTVNVIKTRKEANNDIQS